MRTPEVKSWEGGVANGKSLAQIHKKIKRTEQHRDDSEQTHKQALRTQVRISFYLSVSGRLNAEWVGDV